MNASKLSKCHFFNRFREFFLSNSQNFCSKNSLVKYVFFCTSIWVFANYFPTTFWLQMEMNWNAKKNINKYLFSTQSFAIYAQLLLSLSYFVFQLGHADITSILHSISWFLVMTTCTEATKKNQRNFLFFLLQRYRLELLHRGSVENWPKGRNFFLTSVIQVLVSESKTWLYEKTKSEISYEWTRLE